MPEVEVGRVDGYFAHVGVVGVQLSAALQVGDTIHIKGHTTDLTQSVESIQIDREPIDRAGPGDAIGIKVGERCRKGDHVYKVS